MFFIYFFILINFLLEEPGYLAAHFLVAILYVFACCFVLFLHIVFARFICLFALNPITRIASVFARGGGRCSRELCGFSMQMSPSSM